MRKIFYLGMDTNTFHELSNYYNEKEIIHTHTTNVKEYVTKLLKCITKYQFYHL